MQRSSRFVTNNLLGGKGDPDKPTSQASQISTTSSSSSSSSLSSRSQLICSAGCTACVAGKRQALPTEIPKRATYSLFDKRNIQKGDTVEETYELVKTDGNTVQVPHDVNGASGISSSRFIEFDDKDHNVFVEALVGCTSVVVVSRQGAWMSHLWENPGFMLINGIPDQFQTLTLGYIRAQLTPLKLKFSETDTTKIYIMTPTMQDNNLERRGADSAKGNYPEEYSDRVNDITTLLGTLFPGVPVQKFVYARQNNEVELKNGAFGKAMVSTSMKLCIPILISSRSRTVMPKTKIRIIGRRSGTQPNTCTGPTYKVG